MIYIAILIIFICVFIICDMRLKLVRYSIKTYKVKDKIRLALVTDLHSCRYGDAQGRLISAIKAESPDAVVMSGDIFDDELTDVEAWHFVNKAVDIAPCYYVTGNHELRRSDAEELFEQIEAKGVTVLHGNNSELSVGASKIRICGAEDPEVIGVAAMEQQVESACDSGALEEFSVLLAHRPDLIEMYSRHNVDLALCGHAHGGQWRIPGILNGTFAPNQGIFPKLAGGFYEYENSEMIVSRGLARESTMIPRIFNRPELVIVDIENVTIE